MSKHIEQVISDDITVICPVPWSTATEGVVTFSPATGWERAAIKMNRFKRWDERRYARTFKTAAQRDLAVYLAKTVSAGGVG